MSATPVTAPVTTDRILLTGLECFGHHGVLAHERRDGQRFVVDLELGLDTAPAAAGDDLAATVDYGALALDVRAAVERDPVDLIETLAARIATCCLLSRSVEWARVTVHKPEAPIATPFADVAVSITRTRQQSIDQPSITPITPTQEGRP